MIHWAPAQNPTHVGVAQSRVGTLLVFTTEPHARGGHHPAPQPADPASPEPHACGGTPFSFENSIIEPDSTRRTSRLGRSAQSKPTRVGGIPILLCCKSGHISGLHVSVSHSAPHWQDADRLAVFRSHTPTSKGGDCAITRPGELPP